MEWMGHMIFRKTNKTKTKNRAGMRGMAVAIKSIKESSKIKLGCYRTNKQTIEKARKKLTDRHIKIESPKLPQSMMQIKNRLGYIYNVKHLSVIASEN